MKIWIFNNYNMLPSQGGLNRYYYFAKYLQRMGHEPVVFVGSHPHNTKLQMIAGKEPYAVSGEAPFPWVYVKTCDYEGSKLKRIWSMFQYYRNAKKAAKAFDPPDAVIGSSPHPLAALLAVRMGRKYHCTSVVEVRDLWPESIVAYGVAGPHNPAVVLLRGLEKWLYKKADRLVFTREGDREYLIEQGWDAEHGGPIDLNKVYYVNNGVDLETFAHYRDHFQVQDPDLEDPDSFKVIYTGSIRHVNGLGLLLDTAKEVKDPRVRFLVWGDGDELPALRQRVADEKIGNVVFKGRVEKTYIPYIVSRADLNFNHNTPVSLFRFGISFNKLFDYMAAEKPVLSDFPSRYNPSVQWGAGREVADPTPANIAREIEAFASIGPEAYAGYCANAARAAGVFDFKSLTKILVDVIEGTVTGNEQLRQYREKLNG